jgi:hypothetical protein
MLNNISIQTYKSAKDNKGNETFVHIAIELIKSSQHLKRDIQNIRNYVADIASLQALHEKVSNEPGNKSISESLKARKTEYEALKKQLQAVTWSGTFSQRLADKLKQYSGLLCIDIDKLPVDKLSQVNTRLKHDQYTFLVFISPSGNGLKVLFKVEGGPEHHIDNFKAIENYFTNEYNITIDPSGKDVCRLCFLSYDPHLFSNPDSVAFDHRNYTYRNTVPPVATAPLTRAEEKKFHNAENDLDWIKNFTDKKLTYAEGSRNNYIHLFACNCNRKGIDINDCLNYILSFATDLQQNEVIATTKSAYDHNVIEAGKYAKRQTSAGPAKKEAAKPRDENSSPIVPPTQNGNGAETGYNDEEYIKFWWITA